VSADQFEALLAVQAVDTEIDQLRHRRATLPERAKLKEANDRLAALERDRVGVAEHNDALTAAGHKLEDDIAAVTGKATEVDRTLYSGTVSAPRELTALQEEIAALGRRQRALEDKLLELMEEAEPVEAELLSLDDERAELDTIAVNLTADLAEAEAEIDTALTALTSRRFDAAIPVPSDLLSDYEKLRDRLGGIGVARLVGNRCGGCHLTLSAVEVDRIKHVTPDEVVHCEECGRLLVR